MEVHIEKASGERKKMRISNPISGFIHECEVKFPGCGVQEWSHWVFWCQHLRKYVEEIHGHKESWWRSAQLSEDKQRWFYVSWLLPISQIQNHSVWPNKKEYCCSELDRSVIEDHCSRLRHWLQVHTLQFIQVWVLSVQHRQIYVAHQSGQTGCAKEGPLLGNSHSPL